MAHELMGKFMGIWPSKKAILQWINTKQKNVGHTKLRLGSKVFFIMVFHNLEDKDQVFEGGMHFFNSVGLYLRWWNERFHLEKESFIVSIVWVHLYSLPQDFLDDETLEGINNALNTFYLRYYQKKMICLLCLHLCVNVYLQSYPRIDMPHLLC